MKVPFTMDTLVLVTMKNAVNCDMYCELQLPVKHQIFECILHFPVSLITGISVSLSVSFKPYVICRIQYVIITTLEGRDIYKYI